MRPASAPIRHWSRGLTARALGLLAVGLLCVLLGFWLVVGQQRQGQAEVVAVGAEAIGEIADQDLRLRGEAIAGLLSESLTNPLYYFDLARIGDVVRSAQRLPDVSYVLVYDERGQVVHDGSQDIARFGQVMDDPFGQEAARSGSLLSQQGAEVVDVSVPIRIGDQRIGGVRVGLSLLQAEQFKGVAVARMQADAERRQADSLLLMSAVFIGLACAAAALVWVVLRAMVRPIRRLAEASRQVAEGHYAVELGGRREDEVGDLERDFKRMAQALAKHDQDILRIAYTDPLTGLANRLAFRERLDQKLLAAQARGAGVALLFVDLDDFKRVNDSLGHDAGDHVLEQVAARLSQCLPGDEDSLLARLGGDEFVLLLPGHSRESARRIAESILLELQRPLVAGDRQVFLGASIGITLHPDDASEARSLLKAGDLAMYQAKLAGKNCIRLFSAGMDQAATESAQMEHALRGAWERGELSLSFQPIYDLANRRLVGAEALLRWKHPRLGSVQPSVFIAVAERSGMIEEIGRHVLRAACRAAQGWKFGDSEPFVAVNVSALQLRKGDLPQIVAEVLAESGLAPARLHLELTETAVMGDEVQVGVLVSRLRAQGVKIWLDDFGTGFSGLSHLRRVPVDGVKIDKSFVLDVLRDPDDLALTSAIIALAHSLGFTVVAEGVESEAQFELLRERGCDHAQGFWLGHPVPDATFTANHGSAS